MSKQLAREIKADLALTGITQSAIARKLRVTPNAVWSVIHGKNKPRRIREAIARAIGRDPWRGANRRRAS